MPDRSALSEPLAPGTSPFNLAVELAWDYSFGPNMGSPPVGVAADGVGRLYLKVSKQDPSVGPAIGRVDIRLSDRDENTEPEILGKVMKATVTEGYTTEANGASETTASNAAPLGGTFWFWYVAPDDFVAERPRDEDARERLVQANLTVTFADGTQETLVQGVKVVRPPLMLVHGLGGSSDTWNNFYYLDDGSRRYFKYDTGRFIVIATPDLLAYESFAYNSKLLLGPQHRQSFYQTLRLLRNHGYAANQVYYVGHSMGGSVARYAIGTGGESLGGIGISYAREENYGQGYIDRLITLDTPHLGTPWADLVTDVLIPELNNWKLKISTEVVQYLVGDVLSHGSPLSSFMKRDVGGLLGQYVPSSAVTDLKRYGGETFPETEVPAYLIAGDFWPGKQGVPDAELPPHVWETIRASKQLVNTLNLIYKAYRVYATGEVKAALESLEGVSEAKRAIRTLQIVLAAYYASAVVVDGDLFVSVNSQLAGRPWGESSSGKGALVIDAVSHAILPNRVTQDFEAGNAVFDLLNASIGEGGPFLRSIPPSSGSALAGKAPGFGANLSTRSLSGTGRQVTVADLADLTILSPQPGSSATAGDVLDLRVSLDDTTGLSYIEVSFQGELYARTTPASIYDFQIPVTGTAVDSQAVAVVALFDRGDSTLVAADHVVLDVAPSSPLQRFEVSPLVTTMEPGSVRRPEYTAIFAESIAELGAGSEGLTAEVEDPSVVAFNPVEKTFEGLNEGETSAVVTYRGLADTLYFNVGGLPASPNEVLPVELGPEVRMAERFVLEGTYPNPFNLEATVRFAVREALPVRVELYNALGQRVAVLYEGTPAAEQMEEVRIDGSRLPSGLYFVRLVGEGISATQKVVLLR